MVLSPAFGKSESAWALRDDVSLQATRRDIRRHVLMVFRAWTLPPR